MRNLVIIGLLCFIMPVSLLANKNYSEKDTLVNLSNYVFKDNEGKKISLQKFEGHYVYIDIWAMGCVPCLKQMPYLDELKEKYKTRPIEFVSICVDNNEPAWKDFIQRRKFTGEQYITGLESPFIKENRFMAVPRFLLIDKSGKLLWNRAKFPSDPDLQKKLDVLLAL